MRKLWISAAACCWAVGTFAQAPQDEWEMALQKLSALMYHINTSYVDSVDAADLTENAIVNLLEELDPHSMYIPVEELAEMNEPLQGNFEGVGIQFNILRDTIVVVATIPGGPSEKLGITAGDKIVSIDNDTVAGNGIRNSDVIKRLRGPKGTKVGVGIARRGESDVLKYEITRDKIPLYSLDAHYMTSPETGYIKLNKFARTTMSEFNAALSDLREQGMQNLILDLQGNGGGYLNTAIELADEFLEEGQLVVYTEGRNSPRNNTYATTTGSFEKGKLVILIDESSASASEIVSGAVQDWDRGLIVGRRSFGKGLVQRPVNLPDGSQVRLTIQKYYTPSGRCIQKPYLEGSDAYRMEKYDRYNSGELFSADSIKFDDSLQYFTNNDRIVYGGGGIMPDVYVPIDTSQNSDMQSALIRKGVFNTFSIDYTNRHRDEIKAKHPTPEHFANNFEPSDELMAQFFEAAKLEEIEYSEDDYKTSGKMIRDRLRAHIARNVWDTSAFYQVFNSSWPVYQKALELIEAEDFAKFNLADTK